MIQSALALRLDLAIFVCRVAKKEKQTSKYKLFNSEKTDVQHCTDKSKTLSMGYLGIKHKGWY